MCAKYITQCNESDANILGHANVANDFFSHRVNMYLLFDIGGTKMRMAVSFDGQNMQEVKVVATPRKFEDVLKVIESYIGIADSTRSDKLVCCGLPGTLDKEKSMLISAPNLEEWKMKPIKKAFSKIKIEETPIDMKDMERLFIEKLLKKCNGKKTKVAKDLGLSRTTLWRKLKKHHLTT